MPTITVALTHVECKALHELSVIQDLPQDRVMIQALRMYQRSVLQSRGMFPDPQPTMLDLCIPCGIGFYLPSGICDHCNLPRNPKCRDCGGLCDWREADGVVDKKCRDCGVVQ